MARKVLVTGATGFIGRYVVKELLRRGFEVIASSLDRDKASTFQWFERVRYVSANLYERNVTLDYFNYFHRPDLVIHLAWSELPNYGSLLHFENILPSHYFFLKNIISNGCTNLTVAGTCLEYGMREGSIAEHMITNPVTSYGLAKDCLNKFLIRLNGERIFSLKWVRLFYLYGEGQNTNSLFSQLRVAVNRKDEVFNMSGGEQVRDYLPVEVAASNIVEIALQTKVTGSINCCSGQPVSIKELVQNYIDSIGASIRLNLGYYPYTDYEPKAFWGDNQKLQTILNE